MSLLEFTGLLLAGLAFILVNSRIRLFCSSVSVAIAWLLFACLMAACLANDVERINKPIARLHPLAALLVLLGVAVVWSTGSWGWCLVSSLLFLLFTSAAAALFLTGQPIRYVCAAASMGVVQPLVWRLKQSVPQIATAVFLLVVGGIFCIPNFFWAESTKVHIWCQIALVSLTGMACAIGWFRLDSHARLIGSALLLLASSLLFHYAPLSAFNVAYPAWKRALMVSPGIAAAAWYVTVYLRSRGVAEYASTRNCWIAALSAALAILILARGIMAFPGNVRLAFRVLCVDAENGRVLWDRTVSRGPVGNLDDYRSSGASPTPCTDGNLVFAHFGSATACLTVTGHLRWTHEDPRYALSVLYGSSSSPILVGNSLVLIQDRERAQEVSTSYVAGYDKSSGRLLWRVEPHDAHNAYGTPLAWETLSKPALLAATSGSVLAYDLTNGKRLWSVPIPVEELVTSMVREADRVYVSGGSIRAATLAFRLRDPASAKAPETLWTTTRGARTCASPVLYRGKLFTISQNGVVHCFDGVSGALRWSGRLPEGDYYASLTGADGKIYASSQDGVTTVFEASDTFHVIAQNELGESIYSSPAIARRVLILRTDKALYSIRKR